MMNGHDVYASYNELARSHNESKSSEFRYKRRYTIAKMIERYRSLFKHTTAFLIPLEYVEELDKDYINLLLEDLAPRLWNPSGKKIEIERRIK